jgi:hypothetical protein
VPARSNLFQDTIAIVHQHLAGDAAVEESAMLIDRQGEQREVDVVLRSKIAGHEVVVCVEARATKRKADLTWVEGMLGKHADLPTSKLILVSEAGFTGPAKRKAEVNAAVPIAPRDLKGDHPAHELIQKLSALTVREFTAEITEVVMQVLRPNGERMRVRQTPININVYDAHGGYLTMLIHLFEAERKANAAQFARFESGLGEGESEFTATLAPTLEQPVWNLTGGLAVSRLYARWEEVDPAEMQVIEKFDLTAEAESRDGPTVEMTTRQLDDVAYSYGATTLHGKKALIVITADEAGGKITVRRR